MSAPAGCTRILSLTDTIINTIVRMIYGRSIQFYDWD